MFVSPGSVSVTLASVVLDRPDQSGLYIAKDIAGGWAYVVTDGDGDTRYRGQGSCAGGLHAGLRCGFLSALARVPECRQISILVDTRQAHRAMVKLARADGHVASAIAGRPVAVLTRPHARSSFQARSAAEHAAAAELQQRERAAWQDSEADDVADLAAANASTWQARRRGPLGAPVAHVAPRGVMAPLAPPAPSVIASGVAALGAMMRSGLAAAQQGLEAAGVLAAPRSAPRSRAVTDWLQDFDTRMATVRADLRDVGA
jgi:hypothetical protein